MAYYTSMVAASLLLCSCISELRYPRGSLASACLSCWAASSAMSYPDGMYCISVWKASCSWKPSCCGKAACCAELL